MLTTALLLALLFAVRGDAFTQWRAQRYCRELAQAVQEYERKHGAFPGDEAIAQLLRDAPTLPATDKWSEPARFDVRRMDAQHFQVRVSFPFGLNSSWTHSLLMPDGGWSKSGYFGAG